MTNPAPKFDFSRFLVNEADAARRLACAVMDDSHAADAVVARSLSFAESDAALCCDAGEARILFYRRLYVALIEISPPLDATQGDAFGALDIDERAVLAIVAVAGFSRAEAARILGVTPAEFARRLAAARRRLIDRLHPGAVRNAD